MEEYLKNYCFLYYRHFIIDEVDYKFLDVYVATEELLYEFEKEKRRISVKRATDLRRGCR